MTHRTTLKGQERTNKQRETADIYAQFTFVLKEQHRRHDAFAVGRLAHTRDNHLAFHAGKLFRSDLGHACRLWNLRLFFGLLWSRSVTPHFSGLCFDAAEREQGLGIDKGYVNLSQASTSYATMC